MSNAALSLSIRGRHVDQKAFNDYAKLVFIHIDPKEVHRSISIATNLIVNTVLPYCKKER